MVSVLAQAVYGIGSCLVVVGIIFALVVFISHRSKVRKQCLAQRCRVGECVDEVEMDPLQTETDAASSSLLHKHPKHTTPPPDYATATGMKKMSLLWKKKRDGNGNGSSSLGEMGIRLPVPTPDQFGIYTTHYVTHTPNHQHQDSIIVINGPLSEVR